MKYVIDKNSLHLGGNIRGGDKNTFYPHLWDWIINTYQIKSVLDIGCGTGEMLNYCSSKKIPTLLGIEGLEMNIKIMQQKGIPNIHHDYVLKPLRLDLIFDLGWCCEFVEHVEECYIDHFLITFKSCKLLVMTHAFPRQRGHHHVNCQVPEYWINKIEQLGFKFEKEQTQQARRLGRKFFKKSGLIFQNLDLKR